MSGEFFGELCEDSGAFEVTAAAIAGIAVEDEGGRECSGGGIGGGGGRVVRGEAVVNEGCEHLLITQIGLEMFIGCGAWVCYTTEKVKAKCGGLCGKIRVLQQEFGIERSRSHLLAMERLGIAPVVGLVLVAVGGFVDAEEFALGDLGLLAKNLAAGRPDRVLVGCFGHSCMGLNC